MTSADSPSYEYPDSTLAGLQYAAETTPDAVFLKIGTDAFSYREALRCACAVAGGIRSLGIEPGERVAIMAPNLPETLWSWLGASAAHCIDVPLNAEARGDFLAYVVSDADPRMVIGTADLLERLAACGATLPEFAVCIDDPAAAPFGSGCRHLTFDELVSLSPDHRVSLPGPGEIATIMYTSGTTGRSKGVMLPHRYYPAHGSVGARLTGLTEAETIYCVQPLFHIDARVCASIAMLCRATIALGYRFSPSNTWNEVRRHGATVMNTIGTMIWLLHKRQPSIGDKDHPLRLITSSSTPREIHREFEQRFGVEVIEAYGMTESCYLTATHPGRTDRGSIGWSVPLAELRVVDDDDRPVARREIGELVYRHRDAFTMMQGYWGKPEATVEAWRNLWFHTGDRVREREDGQFEYIGRKKDSIRRRGENVSAWEVEQAATKHRDVLEVAALGVASDVGEEDVAILVVLRAAASIAPNALHAFLDQDLPRFAVPRYIEFVDRLPKTPSERIAKGEVRARGITPAAWDADAGGRR